MREVQKSVLMRTFEHSREGITTDLKKSKRKAISVHAWRGSEGSRRLRLQIRRQSAHEGGKVAFTLKEIILVL